MSENKNLKRKLRSKSIKQSQLSAECWVVQVWGLRDCESCDLRNSKECGGKNIRKTGKNALGFTVPLEDQDDSELGFLK